MSEPRPVRRLLNAALLTAALGVGLGSWSRTTSADDDCSVLLREARREVQEAEARFEADDIPKSKSAAIKALALAEQAHERCPTNRDACLMGVFAAVFENDYTKGRIWVERYTALSPYGERDPQLHYLRALVQTRLVHRYDLALRSLERMHALEPRLEPRKRDLLYLETLTKYGAELSKAERYDDAIRQFYTAAVVARRTGNIARERAARANVGVTLKLADRFKEAADVFRDLHKEAPDNPIWSYEWGLALANQSQFLLAIDAYRHSLAKQVGVTLSVEVRDEVARARLRLGNCLKLYSATLEPVQRAKILKQAEDELKTYIAEKPKDALGHLYAGMLLYEEHRDFAGALAYFREAFRLDSKCENMLRFLINAHRELVGPPKQGGAAHTAEEKAAWKAEQDTLQKDLEENMNKRKEAVAAVTAVTGDLQGGCQ